jgi:uncharacterized protein YjbJ (UPF0337 family)
MEPQEMKESWNEQKCRLKKKFAILSDSDFMIEEGKKEEMINRLQVKLGKSKDELRQIIASL